MNTLNIPSAKSLHSQLAELSSSSEMALYDFSLSVLEGTIESTKSKIPEMEKIFHELNDYQQLCYLYDLFDHHIYNQDYVRARTILERIKTLRLYRLSPVIKYYETFLDFLNEENPIYLYLQDFEDIPLLYHQVSCLKHLENGRKDLALIDWEKLQLLRPKCYEKNFTVIGVNDLFSQVLHKLIQPKEISVTVSAENKNIERLLTLLNTGEPVEKEFIHCEIWQRPLETKSDLNKLAKLVEKAKSKYSLEIKSQKGSYILKPSKKAS